MEKTNNDKRQVHADCRPRHIFCTETNFQQSLGIVKLKSFFFFPLGTLKNTKTNRVEFSN